MIMDYPLRAIVPGFYGMMNPKWITEIELVDSTYEGFWQRKGWTNNPNNNIYSTIVTAGNQEITNRFPNLVNNNFAINKSNQIAGIAFAGNRGISKIEGKYMMVANIGKQQLSKIHYLNILGFYGQVHLLLK